MALRINIPPVTRAILSAIASFTFLYGIARWRQFDGTLGGPIPYLTLVPSKSLYYPWTFLSASFVEPNLFTVLITGATIFYGGKYLERAWGSKEFGKFILVVSLVPNAVIVPLYVLCAALTGSSSIAYVS